VCSVKYEAMDVLLLCVCACSVLGVEREVSVCNVRLEIFAPEVRTRMATCPAQRKEFGRSSEDG
jgi:hypothetical protein